MRTVLELKEVTVRSPTDSNRPVKYRSATNGLLFLHVPCTSSSAGSLSFFDNGEVLTAVQVIFEASVEDTGRLSDDFRRSWDASIVTGLITIPSFPFTKSVPSLLQPSKLPIPEQLN